MDKTKEKISLFQLQNYLMISDFVEDKKRDIDAKNDETVYKTLKNLDRKFNVSSFSAIVIG